MDPTQKDPPQRPATLIEELLAQHGELGENLLRVDWSATQMGPPETWPPSLVTAVSTMLDSRFPIWMAWGEELTFLCNDAYRRSTLGSKYPEALGRPAREVWGEVWEFAGPRIASVMQTGQATWDENLELHLQRHGYREETYHTFSYSPLRDDSGAVSGVFAIVTEETERVVSRRQLEALRQLAASVTSPRSEAELFAAAEQSLKFNQRSMPWAAVYRFSHTGDAELVMHSGIAAGGAATPELIRADDPDPVWPIDQLRRGASVDILDLDERFENLPTGAWDVPPQRALLVPMRTSGEPHPYGFLVAATNPLHQLHPELRRFIHLVAGILAGGIRGARSFESQRERADELTELDRAKTEFFTNVSHELRTPLALMLGPAEDALSDVDDPLSPGQRERVEVLFRNGRRLLNLVNSLLDFARAEVGEIEADLVPLDPAPLTAEIAAMFEPAAVTAELEYVVDCRSPRDTVLIDREMWVKIVTNLLTNALKFTLEGSIHVRTFQQGDRFCLEVADTGLGIAGKHQEAIFERFQRVGTARGRSHEGAGVGLALVKELTSLQGGSVRVESAPDQGSTFVVELPASSTATTPAPRGDLPKADQSSLVAAATDSVDSWIAEDPARSRRAASEGDSGPAAVGLGQEERLRVLVVDDNADMRAYLTRTLGQRYEVESAVNGVQALEAVRKSPPDLVLSDAMMPELDGFGLLARMRDDPALMHIPLVMISARGGEEGVVGGLEAGADDYLVKPFTARELNARVDAVLELDRTRRAHAALERQRQQLQTAQRIARLGSWQLDPVRRRLTMSEQSARIIGSSPQELAELGPRGAVERYIVDPTERQRILDALNEALVSGRIELETELALPSGEQRWLRITGELAEDEVSGEALLRGTIQDITERIAAQAALTEVEATRLVAERERAIAAELQRSLLPDRTFANEHLEIASAYRAGEEGTEVGGDWFDVIELDSERTALVIGDVMGRGIPAATTMGRLSTATRSLALLGLPPSELVEVLDELIGQFTESQLVTMIYGVFDAAENCFSYVNAGHLPPVICDEHGARLLGPAGGPPIVAGLERRRRREEEVELSAGAKLLMHTDGLVERRNGDIDEQTARVMRAVEEFEGPLERLPDELIAKVAPSSGDDIALFVARVATGSTPTKTAELEIRKDAAEVGRARRWATAVLTGWHVSAASVADAVLIVSELLSNAIRHAEEPIVLRVARTTTRLRIQVTDAAQVEESLGGGDGDGHGLKIVEQLARRWGTTSLAAGKTVWCVLDAPEEGAHPDAGTRP